MIALQALQRRALQRGALQRGALQRDSADLRANSAVKDQHIARLTIALAAKGNENAQLKARVAELEQWVERRQRQGITFGRRDPSLV
jgi:hypothetical protein